MMFLIGAVPALLALVIRRRLKEPEKWQQAKAASRADSRQAGSRPAGSSRVGLPGNGDAAGIASAGVPPTRSPTTTPPKVATAPAPQMGSYSELFRHPTLAQARAARPGARVLRRRRAVGRRVLHARPDAARAAARGREEGLRRRGGKPATAAGDAALAAQ